MKVSKDYGHRRVMLSPCSTSPIEDMLSKQPTTSCGMNFISWNKAYSLFPRTTFIDHQIVPFSPQTDDQIASINDFETMGFTVRNLLYNDAQQWAVFPDRSRYVGDEHTWRLNLDTSGITKPDCPDYVLEVCGFTMHFSAYRGAMDGEDEDTWDMTSEIAGPAFDDNGDWCGLWCHIRLESFEYTHPSLRYSFLCHAENGVFGEVFTEVLDLHARRQIFKLDKAKRDAVLNSRYFSKDMYRLSEEVEFERPKDWVYRDDLVLKELDKIVRQVSMYELLGPDDEDDY